MPFDPFLIADLISGKITKRDAWLLPNDGFVDLDNCHLKRGVLEKRRGRTKMGQIVKTTTDGPVVTLSTNPVMGIYNHVTNTSETLLVFDKERMNTFVSSISTGIAITAFADGGGGTVDVTAGTHGFDDGDTVTISGTTNYNGTFIITLIDVDNFTITDTFVADDATGTVSEEQFEDVTRHRIRFDTAAQSGYDPAVDDVIQQAVSGATGTVEAVIIDFGSFAGQDAIGTIVFKIATVTGTFNSTGQLFESGVGANIVGDATTAGNDSTWSGDNEDFFWAENWTLGGASKTYLTNNVDPVEIFNGTHLTEMAIDIGLDSARAGVNDVTRALLVFLVKERIVIFNITESGVVQGQRARWSGIKTPHSWPTSSFVDAPTVENIVAAEFLDDDLYVWFENSVWEFEWTGDSVSPFRWRRVSSQDGGIAQMSLTTRDHLQRAVGPTKILGNDGNRVGPIDGKIPDVVIEWNPDSTVYSVGADVEEQRQIYFTYARPETTAHADGNKYPDRVLVYNYEDDNWATYRHPIHSMGFSSLESDVTWSIDDAWEDIDFAWNDGGTVSGFPLTLMGDHSGVIFTLNSSGADNASAIEFNAKTARFNPYHVEGRQAKFWKVSFLCDVDANVTFDVEFFLNSDSTKYKTVTITTSGSDSADDKQWFDAHSGAAGFFHSLNLTNNASTNMPRIHAMRLWFKPAGREK